MKTIGNKWLRPAKESVATLVPYIAKQVIEHTDWENFMHIARWVENQIANQVLTAGFAGATIAEMWASAGLKLTESIRILFSPNIFEIEKPIFLKIIIHNVGKHIYNFRNTKIRRKIE